MKHKNVYTYGWHENVSVDFLSCIDWLSIYLKLIKLYWNIPEIWIIQMKIDKFFHWNQCFLLKFLESRETLYYIGTLCEFYDIIFFIQFAGTISFVFRRDHVRILRLFILNWHKYQFLTKFLWTYLLVFFAFYFFKILLSSSL